MMNYLRLACFFILCGCVSCGNTHDEKKLSTGIYLCTENKIPGSIILFAKDSAGGPFFIDTNAILQENDIEKVNLVEDWDTLTLQYSNMGNAIYRYNEYVNSEKKAVLIIN